MVQGNDRRQHTRISVRIPAKVHLTNHPERQPIDAEILDISRGGAFVHCTAPVFVGHEISLQINFEATEVLHGKVVEEYDAVEAKDIPKDSKERSVVKWVRGSAMSGFGIEFLGLGKEKVAFLDKLVSYFEKLGRAGVDFKP